MSEAHLNVPYDDQNVAAGELQEAEQHRPGHCARCDESRPAHLQGLVSNRGFLNLPTIPSQYGGYARVYESSSASGPHIWLSVKCPQNLNEPDGPSMDAVAHLTLEDAVQLAEQITLLVDHHYQHAY